MGNKVSGNMMKFNKKMLSIIIVAVMGTSIILLASNISVNEDSWWNFWDTSVPVVYVDDGEPYVGPAEGNLPLVSGIVPVVTLVDSFGKEHKMSSKTISLSVVDIPTIQATNGKLKIGLKAYFDRPDLVDRYGQLQSWELSGTVVVGTDCNSLDALNNLGSFQFQAFGNSKPTQQFSPLISGISGVVVEENNEAVISFNEWTDNIGRIVAIPFDFNREGWGNILNWCASNKDIVRDITVSVIYNLKLVGEYDVITLSGTEEVTHLYAKWDVSNQSLIFYESGDIYRVDI